MDPSYRPTISDQKERTKKRSNIQTSIPYTDDEERETKRNRLSSHTSGNSMYARIPQGLYQQPSTQPSNNQLPYITNRFTNESLQRHTPEDPSSHNMQDNSQDRLKMYEKIAAGLGRSILNPQPFQEESDSSDSGDMNDTAGQAEKTGYTESPLFVSSSSEGARAPNAEFEAQNSQSDDVLSIYSGHQQSHLNQPQDARLHSKVPGRRIRFNLQDTAHIQHASDHEQARYPRSIPGENRRSDHRQRPGVRSTVVRQQSIQTRAGALDSNETNRAQPQYQPTRAHYVAPHIPSHTPEQSLDTSAARPSQKSANHQPPPSGVSPTPIGDTRPKRSIRPEGFQAPKNILNEIKRPKNCADRVRSYQPQQDLDYPANFASLSAQDAPVAPILSINPITPIAPTPITSVSRPSARYVPSSSVPRPDSTTSSSIQDLASKIPEEQLKRFVPNQLDNQVWSYMHRNDPMDWNQIKEFLDLTGTPYVLETLKTRQKIYEAKRKLTAPERKTEDEKIVEKILAPILAEFVAPLPVVKHIPEAPVVQPDAKRLANTLEQERLAWATKEAEYQERVRILEDASAARTAELKENEKQLKLKNEVQEKYQKLKEEAQSQKGNLKDEKALRIKAERDLKAAQSDINRRALAAAGAARTKGKATDTGFAFSNDGEDLEDEDAQKKTPVKRSKSRKPNSGNNLREDGHPRTAGKTLPPAAIQALYKHLNSCKDEEVEETPEFIQEEELSYFVYTVYRKQWLNDEQEPDDETKIACGSYTYLNAANVAVTNEILRPHGTASAIKIDPKQDRSLHQGMSEHDMSWAQLDVSDGHVKVWVQRQLHTEFEGKLPLFEDKGILTKTVFAIIKETSSVAPDSASETIESAPVTVTTIEEGDEIYTTFDLANRTANKKVFNLLWPEEPSGTARKTTLGAVQAKEEARKEREQRMEDLEDHGQLFTEEIDREDGTKVKIFVLQKTVTGPRN
ncbi:hypothetical protein E4T44_03866 [Aureobasidium sp. EXF-8845]|nr:hypothetical protein E4T44_03866 [Aureobasidium sp. EXF-8845]KAI4854641.1 hypothetical protein E4T45_03912 [Aureobasidium sp. EXF-8846]